MKKPTTLYVPVDINLDTVTDNQTIALNVVLLSVENLSSTEIA